MKKFFLILALIVEIAILIIWISLIFLLLLLVLSFSMEDNSNLMSLLVKDPFGFIFAIIIVGLYVFFLFSIIHTIIGTVKLLKNKPLTSLNLLTIVITGFSIMFAISIFFHN